MKPLPRPLLRLLLPLLLAGGRAGLSAQETPTTPWPQPDPSGSEQVFLELINRARADPPAEGVRLAAVTDPGILANYRFFQVSTATVLRDFSGYTPRPPLAMNALLMASARAHSLDMAAHGVQRHDGTDGSTFDGRITAADYRWSAVGENIYGWVKDPFFGHVGFNVDWGVPALDHRVNVMGLLADAPDFKEVGVAYVPTPLPDFGPHVVTEDFAAPEDATVAYVLGVVYNDSNSNGSYDQGEGLAGVTVMPDSGTFYAVTPAAGGFVIPLPASGAGTMTLTASGGGLGTARTKTITWTAGTNVKVDFTTADPPAAAPAASSPR